MIFCLLCVVCWTDGTSSLCIQRPSIQLYVHKRSHLCLWRAPSSTVYLLVFCFGRLFSNANLHADDDCGGSVRAKTVLARITCFREMAIWRATGFCRRGLWERFSAWLHDCNGRLIIYLRRDCWKKVFLNLNSRLLYPQRLDVKYGRNELEIEFR